MTPGRENGKLGPNWKLCSVSGGEEQHFQLNTDINVASLILHVSIAEITAQLLLYLMCI